jgi:alcohol dehydrogenase (cytochrome c)
MKSAALLLAAAASLSAQNVTFDRILHPDREPQNWLTYSGGVEGRRYSPLTQITPANVKTLELNWVWQARSTEKFEATALVVDGILYTVAPPNDVVALDGATGRPFWTYSYNNAAEAAPCCGRVNRGLAILGDTLFMGTLDAHLIALDARTGRVLWNTQVGNPAEGYTLTHAPLVVKDKVIIGPAGGDRGIRGFIAAYDAHTGKEVWRFNTVPGPGEPGHESWSGDSWKQGGAAIWTTGAYDPDLNLTYWGTGNPGPDWNGDERAGDNLYSDSVVALDADTGKLKWHFQFTPHDEFDYDSTQVPVLADVQWQGRTRKAMLWANRNGFFYVLDRSTGQFLQAKPFVQVTWANGFDEKGRPMRVPGKLPTDDGTLVYPALGGGTNWFSPSYSPKANLFYIPSVDNTSSIFTKKGFPLNPVSIGLGQTSLQPNLRTESEGYGAIRAYDPQTGERKWEFKMGDVTQAGVLSTASDLVFSGGRDGYFYALDGRTGALLWKLSLGGQIISGPMSYSVNGKQYIAVAAGTGLFTFTLR